MLEFYHADSLKYMLYFDYLKIASAMPSQYKDFLLTSAIYQLLDTYGEWLLHLEMMEV